MDKVLAFIFLYCSCIFSQDSLAINNVLVFQEKLNKKFASEDESPLMSEEFKKFQGLDFFEIDMSYSVQANFVRTPFETPFIMRTTTQREPIYVKYGEAHFVLKDKELVLNIYQNQSLKMNPEYENYLFLPFTDKSNDTSTYQGGRFIDLQIPEGSKIRIDFNTAYNPYCAYNIRYSCPIPPEENHIALDIPVGVKRYKKPNK